MAPQIAAELCAQRRNKKFVLNFCDIAAYCWVIRIDNNSIERIAILCSIFESILFPKKRKEKIRDFFFN